jgi:hypothetical protein
MRLSLGLLLLLALAGCASIPARDWHPALQNYELQCCDGGGGRG